MMQQVIGGPVLPHPQKIARLWFPQYAEHTTPSTRTSCTSRAPIRPIPAGLRGRLPSGTGGTGAAAGSHKIDAVHDHHFSLGAGSLAIDTEQLEGQWVTTDYGIGDTLIFHSLTVHQALPNPDGRPAADLAG